MNWATHLDWLTATTRPVRPVRLYGVEAAKDIYGNNVTGVDSIVGQPGPTPVNERWLSVAMTTTVTTTTTALP